MKTQTVLVSVDSSSALRGARQFKKQLEESVKNYSLDNFVEVLETGTLGVYRDGVIIAIYPDEVFYEVKNIEDLEKIVTEHLLKGRAVNDLLIEKSVIKHQEKEDKLDKEQRIVLKNVGIIDPREIDEYIARDGYQALAKVLNGMKPEDVIAEVKNSNLRGRGGAGFPTGMKWEFTAKTTNPEKYVICNADEGEPGTFKDRLIMEGDPHSVVEAMTITGYAVGANKGYIYIRGEYHGSIDNIRKAIKDAYEYGLLGENIFGTDFSFDLSVRLGAGAYICGEETALIESIEGRPGRPRLKPPYPPVEGLYGKPTVVNNVETFANVPWIINNGSDAFKAIGTEGSAGTKVFTLVGNVINRGLVEVPMGTSLFDLIYKYGGGIPNGKELKIVQTGGTAGTFMDTENLSVGLDYDSWKEGASLGSGVILCMDEDSCAVDCAKTAMEFFAHESCGKCTPCREGTGTAVRILRKIAKGQGTSAEVDQLLMLADVMEQTAFCGLGQAAPIPLRTIVNCFRDEFEAHVAKKPCNCCKYEDPKKKKRKKK